MVESPSGKCAKRPTLVASNNRDHPTRSLYYCLPVPHIYGCYSSRTSRSHIQRNANGEFATTSPQTSREVATVPPLLFLFLDSWFFLPASLLPGRFMSKPSLNHVPDIKCSQIRKRFRNASIIGVSSLVHGFSNFFVLRPILNKYFLHDLLRPVTRGAQGAKTP